MVERLLSDAQAAQLKSLLENETDETIRLHIQVLLLSDRGLYPPQIADELNASLLAVFQYRKSFREKGFESLPQHIASLLPQRDVDSPMPVSIDQFMNRYDLDLNKADFMRSLALSFFDQTQGIHAIDADYRKILDAAVRLHNIQEKPKGSSKALQSQAISDFSEQERDLVAFLIRSQRGKINKRVLNALSDDEETQNIIRGLIAILVLTLALDSSGSQSTQIESITTSDQRLLVSVRGPHACSDAIAGQQHAHLWNKLYDVPLSIISPSIDDLEGIIDRAREQKSPGIDPEDSMSEAGRKVMRFLFAQMLYHEPGTRAGEDIEELHDMRVATRRMRAAFEVFGPYFRKKAIRPYLKGLRATGRALGPVRDLDVFMQKAQTYLESLPEDERGGLDPVLNSWKSGRIEARQKMMDYLDSHQYREFIQTYNQFLNSPGEGARSFDPDNPVPNTVREVAPMLIFERLAAVRAYEALLDNATIEQLHMLRIEFKKLRYTVEFFREVLGEEGKKVVDDIKRFQDHLGDLNDADVACGILNELLEGWESGQTETSLSERVNPEPVVAYLASKHAERHQLIVTFPQAWEHFNRAEFRANLAQAISIL